MEELIDTSAMRIFVVVVEAASFTNGAKRVGLTRSAAGKAVARLEEELGVRLLHRTTRSFGLTPDGRVFYDRAVQILAELDDIKNAMTISGGTPRGTLRVTAPEGFGREMVLPMIVEFMELWPGLKAETDFTDRVIDIVDEGFDVAVRFGSFPGASDLIGKVVARSSGKLCASPSYLARQGEIGDLMALDAQRTITADGRGGSNAWPLFDEAGEKVEFAINPAFVTSDASSAREAAIAGLGVAFLPLFLIQKEVVAGRLEIVLPQLSSAEIPISLIYPNRKHLSPRVRNFIDFVADKLSKLPHV